MTIITRRQQQRNLYHHSPISNLPREVLSLVFLEVKIAAAGVPSNTDIESQALAINDWVRVSHVCHAWKAIALGCSELWTTIYVTSDVYKWAAEFFRRSRGQPFDLYISIPSWSASASAHRRRIAALVFVEKTVLKNMRRCRNFVLNKVEQAITSRLLTSATDSTLRSVVLDSIDWRGPGQVPPVLPEELAALRCITRLILTWCAHRYHISDLPNLTHIELRHLDCSDRLLNAANGSYRSLLQALSDLPQLRHLVLQEIYGDEDDDPIALGGSVLPKLRFGALQYFELIEEFNRAYVALGNILLRQSCDLSIEASGLPCSSANGTSVLNSFIEIISSCRSLSAAPHPSHDKPSRYARIILSPLTKGMALETFSEDGHPPPQSVDSRASLQGRPALSVRLGYRNHPESPLSDTLEMLPLLTLLEPSQIKTLEIVGLGSQSWHYQPSHAHVDIRRHLDILLNNLDDPSDIKSAAKCTCKAAGRHCTWAPRFPALETIDIRRGDNTFTFLLDSEFLRRMRTSLGLCLKHGLSVPHLRLPVEFDQVPKVKLGTVVKDCEFVKRFSEEVTLSFTHY